MVYHKLHYHWFKQLHVYHVLDLLTHLEIRKCLSDIFYDVCGIKQSSTHQSFNPSFNPYNNHLSIRSFVNQAIEP